LPGRATVLLPAVLLALLAAGCSGRQSAFPERIELACFAGAPDLPGTVCIGLAPSRARRVEVPGPGGRDFVGGDFDIFMDAPLCDAGTEGYFVAVPARIGALFLAMPFFILGLPFMLSDNERVGYYAFAPTYVMLYVGAIVVGGPFWVVREVLWDAPCAFGRWLALSTRGPKGKVDFLVPRSGHPRIGDQVDARLRKLTGEPSNPAAGWPAWWQLHREEFDDDMTRVKPAGPERQPTSPGGPVPKPTPAPAH
jgi:hypothetical protein